MNLTDKWTEMLGDVLERFETTFKKDSLQSLPPPVATPPKNLLFPEALAPDKVEDKVRIHAALEQGKFSKTAPSQDLHTLRVVAYNLERGMHFEEQLHLLQSHEDLKDADILLLNEMDRGCSRTGCRNVARDLARGLNMNFVYGVEYVELPRKAKLLVNHVEKTCEHGNAIFSRFPLLNIEQIRHAQSENWYGRRDQPRLGGCLTLKADVQIGKHTLRLYCVHLGSGPQGETHRRAQIREVLEHLEGHDGPVVVGGDMNTLLYTADVWMGTRLDETVGALRDAWFEDAHGGLKARERGTTDTTYGFSGVIDLIFSRGLTTRKAGVVDSKRAGHLSDHLPIWAQFSL